MKKLKLIQMSDFIHNDFPLFVQSGDMRGFMGWGIKIRTGSNWNHSMVMRRPFYVCSQGWTYKEIPVRRYFKKYIILKFWKCKDINVQERYMILRKIEDDLKLPLWKRIYDFPGILGQAVGLRWINMPFLNYCSERVAGRVKILIPDLKKHPSPEDLDTAFKKSERFEVAGYWFHGDL